MGAASDRSGRLAADARPPPVGALADGHGEVTLVVYSVFMAATSLLLLLLAHVHQVHSGSAAGADSAAPVFALASPRTWLAGLLAAVARLQGLVATAAALLAAIDIRTLLCTAAALVSILSIAYWTNPSDASFRTYLADLSLRQHLRQLHEDAVPPQLTGKDAGAAELAALSLAGADGAPERYASPHVLTFANRISISLRTPPYCRRDLGLFSVVSVTHVLTDGQRGGSNFSARRPTPDGKVDCAHCGTLHAPGSQRSWFIGAFGRWFGGTLSCAFEARAERPAAEKSAAAARPYGVLSLSCQDDAATDNLVAGSTDGKDDSVDDPAGDVHSAAHGDSSAAASATRGTKAARRRKHPHKPRPNQPPPAKDPDRAPPNDALAQDASPTTTPRSADASSIHPPTDSTSTSSQNKATNAGAASAAPAESDAGPARSSALAALQSKLSNSSSAVSELHQQLEQLHASSDSTRVQLQTQLDELRARKREDDAARIDLRGRMKSLDESKRHAEGSRREAERRLKAATSLREAIEGRIESKGREMEALREREIASAKRVEASKEHRVQRSKEIEEEVRAKGEAETALAEEIEQLNAKLAALEERILEEDANLEATRELAAERYRSMLHEASLEAAASQQHAAMANGPLGQHMHGAPPPGHLSHLAPSHQYAPQQQVPHRMYPLLSGPGDGTQLRDAEPFGPQAFDAGWGANGADMYGMPGDMHGLAPPRLVVSNGREASFDPTFDPTRSLAHRSSDADAEFLPFFPDDKADERRISNAGADPSLLSARRGAPGQMTLPPSNLLPRTPPPRGFQPNGPQTPFTPLSPFSTDLLPSNLFLNTDDDAGHAGILPGTRSERVEAALGRFGLDTSDTSDMEGGAGSDADTIDEAAELQLAGQLEGLEPGQTLAAAAGQSDAEDLPTAKGSRRSWWGGKARTPSKEAGAAAPAEDAEASSDAASAELDTSSKRRSLSLFPKLSLNPGAKAFRSSSRKQAAAVPMRGPLDSWPVGSQPAVPSDYEAVRRAFDTTVGADEEQGRRSWSAFDTWAHQGHVAQQEQQRAMQPQTAAQSRFGRGPFPRHPYLAGQSGLGPGGMRSSSDSLPHASGGAASREWLGSGEDVFNPIARTTSHPGSSVASGSPSNSDVRSSRLRSFFRAADGSKSASAAAAKTFETPDMLTPPASAGASHGDADADEAGVTAASPKSKRSAFRW